MLVLGGKQGQGLGDMLELVLELGLDDKLELGLGDILEQA